MKEKGVFEVPLMAKFYHNLATFSRHQGQENLERINLMVHAPEPDSDHPDAWMEWWGGGDHAVEEGAWQKPQDLQPLNASPHPHQARRCAIRGGFKVVVARRGAGWRGMARMMMMGKWGGQGRGGGFGNP